MAEPTEDPLEGTRMTLGEHLAELRRRLIRGIGAIFIAFVVGLAFYESLSDIVLRPLYQTLDRIDSEQVEKYEGILAENPDQKRELYFTSSDPANMVLRPEFTVEKRPVATAIGEQFWFALKSTVVFALFIGGPILLYQLWQFVAAGLYPSERKLVMSYFPYSTLLFLAGVLFGYFLVLPYGMYFLATAFAVEKVRTLLTLSLYFSFVSTMCLALGVVFQLPLVMTALVHVDLVPRAAFKKYRAHFVVAAFVLCGAITPPDPYTQAMMAIPMLGLYELGLFVTRYIRPAGQSTTASATPDVGVAE